jgi:hypothetical protein
MCHPSLMQVTDLHTRKGKKMKQATVQEIYAVRLFMFGNIFEVKTFNSYNYALDWAIANLENSDWDIKKVRQ